MLDIVFNLIAALAVLYAATALVVGVVAALGSRGTVLERVREGLFCAVALPAVAYVLFRVWVERPR